MAENMNGSLVFKSTIDNTEFNTNIAELENRIRAASHLTIIEGNRIENVLKKIGAGIISYFSLDNLQTFTAHLIKVRSEFQNVEASLKVFLGSGTQAKEFMKELQSYAISNVFEFKDLAKVSTQLLAYGNNISTVIPIIEKLSNIASGTNVPLADLANLYNKAKAIGKLMTVDLQQWQRIGVPIVQQMAKEYKTTQEAIWEMAATGKISFKDIEKTLNKLTSSGGMFFGMMKEKMGNLGDTVGQLNDSLTIMFNEIGEYSQDYLKGGLLAVNTLVENYKQIGKTLLSVSIAYGSYRAALVLNTLATKGHTGIALIDNTVKQAKLALLKAEATLTGANTAIQNKMTAAQLANIAALKAKLTIQEQEQLLNKLKTQTLQGILNTEQLQYLSNLKLTKGTQEYSKAAMEVLSVEQKQYLKKADLSKNSSKYIELLSQEVIAKEKSSAASLAAMRADVQSASRRTQDLKLRAMAAMQGVEIAKQEVYLARGVSDAVKLQRAEKNLLLATEQASITRKAVLASHTEFLTKKKALETAATRKSILASNVDTVSKTTQSAATTILSSATNKAALAVRTLWASMKANPIGWLISLIGLAISAFTMFSKKKEESVNINKQINDQIKEEIGYVGALIRALNDANDSTYLRKQVLEKLNPLLSRYNLELLNEGDALSKINEQYQKVEKSITATTVARLKEREIKKIDQETNAQLEDLAKNTKEQIKKVSYTQELDNSYARQGGLPRYNTVPKGWSKGFTERDYEIMTGYLSDLTAQLKPIQDKIYEYQKEYNQQKEKDSSILNKINALNEEANKSYEKGLDSVVSIMARKAKENGASGKEEDLEKQLRSDIGNIAKEHLNKSKDIYNTDNKKKDNVTSYKILGEIVKPVAKDQTKLNTQTTEQTIKQQQELAQKQLDSDLRLEQSRIDIMEEGYEKRVAQAQFQHKQTIASINKEEQDLNKSYASMGAKMPTAYKDNFDERRANEEAALAKQINGLFTTELDYKKQQYELYYKWVEYMGEAAADKQFEKLLKNGDSYRQYIENQIAALEQKKASGGLTAEETNKLISLNAHSDTLNNKVNPLEAFTASLQESLSGASNLAQELDIIIQKKKELEEGKSGIINKDQLDSAKTLLSSKEQEINKQLQQKLLTDFKTYQEKKLAIENEYQKLIELAEKGGNAGRIAEVKKQRDTELSALNASMLMETDSWKNLFSDLDTLSVDAIDKLVKEIESNMANANLQLNPAEWKALLDRLDEAKAKLVEKNPFAALGYALTAIFKQGSKESEKKAAQIQRDWANLASASQGSFSFISSIVSDSKVIKDLLGDSAEDLLNGLQNIDKAMQGVATLGASIASGNVFGIIAGGLQLAVGVADFIDNIFSGDKSKDKQIENLQKGVQSLQRDYERLGTAIQNTYSNQALSLMDEQDANLRQQQVEIMKMIEMEKSKKRSDPNKINALQKQQEDINRTLEENNRKRMEMLAGTDVKTAIDQFGDALVQAYVKGENAAEKLGEVTKKVMKKAAVDAIKRQFLAKGIEEATKYLSSAMTDGVLSESERQQFENMVNAAGAQTQAALAATGDWLKDEEAQKQDSLTGAVKGVTEETASILAGRINQIVLYQTDGLETMRQALLYHAEVAANTRNIAITNATLKRIEDKLNSNPLLSQGIS